MSMYESVLVYSLDGDIIGYGIKNTKLLKLQTTNLYAEHEVDKLNEQLARLNNDVTIKSFWPNPKDPEVLAILANDAFMPIEYITAEVVDDERSTYVWTKEMEVDEHGNPTGRLIEGADIDRQASRIYTKLARVPKNKTDELVRIKAASEVVAKRRAKEAGISL